MEFRLAIGRLPVPPTFTARSSAMYLVMLHSYQRRVVLDCSKHLSPSRAKPSPLGPIDHTSRIAAIRRIPKAIERLRTCANNSVMDDMLQRADFRSPSGRAASATGSERVPRPTGVSASA